MIKTQVQIPDELYHRAKQIAKEREMSFAEVVRRGLEYMAQAYPPSKPKEGVSGFPVLHNFTPAPGFDKLDFRKIVADEESERGLPRD
jgi:hypothetical protein